MDNNASCTNKEYLLTVCPEGNLSLTFSGDKYTKRGMEYHGSKRDAGAACLLQSNLVTQSIGRRMAKLCDRFQIRNTEIPIYTEHRLFHDEHWYDIKQMEDTQTERVLYRADPGYDISTGKMVAHTDWAVMKWRVAGIRRDTFIPGRIL